MTALKKPFKINVIDEEADVSEVKKKKKSSQKEKSFDSKSKKNSQKRISSKSKKIIKDDKKNKKQVSDIDVVKKALNLSENISQAKDEIDLEQSDSSIVKMKKKLKSFQKKIKDKDEKKIEDKNIEKEDGFYKIKGTSVRDVIAEEQKKSFLVEEKELKDDVEDEIVSEDEILGKKPSHSIKIYKRIAVTFIFLTFCLVSVMLYFTFVRVTIVITPTQERINSNMIFDIYDREVVNDKNQVNSIKGIVEKININHSEKYESSGEKILGKEAVGVARIINNYNKNQPLVATTRLLPVNEQDKLFRIRKTVNVPAGGFVEVEIYADDPSPEMSIKPTKFTIPGLWAGLQDQIYAESDKVIEYKKKVEKFVTDDDIIESKIDLKEKLIQKAKKEVDYSYGDYGEVIYDVDENSIEINFDVAEDDKVDNFKSEMNADVVVVAFFAEEAVDLAKAKFISSLDNDKEMVSFNEKNIIYTLNKYDMENKIATINATFEGKASLNKTSNIIDKNEIIGLNKEQIEAYLTAKKDIASYEVKFYPPFIKKISKLIEASKIKIEIKN